MMNQHHPIVQDHTFENAEDLEHVYMVKDIENVTEYFVKVWALSEYWPINWIFWPWFGIAYTMVW